LSPLPSGWTEARLDELADVRLGRQRSPKNHAGDRMRPYLRAANVTWNGLDLADVKDMNFSERESVVYELQRGDVLVAEASGSASEVGKPALWNGEIDGCCFQNTLVRVRSRGPAPEYLRYFLFGEARSGRLGEAAPGVGIHHIGAARLSAWTIPVPPLNEQRRIVAMIEEQFSRLNAAESTLKQARSRLDAMRGSVIDAAAVAAIDRWGLSGISDVCSTVTSGSTPAADKMTPASGDIPFIKVYNLTTSGTLDFSKRPTFIGPSWVSRSASAFCTSCSTRGGWGVRRLLSPNGQRRGTISSVRSPAFGKARVRSLACLRDRQEKHALGLRCPAADHPNHRCADRCGACADARSR
jgi:hypothetical protein